MKEFQSAKETYENTPIPAALEECVQTGIRKGKAKYQNRRRIYRRWLAAAACFCVVLAGLNLSPGLSAAAANVPVLGKLFQVLTFVDYQKTEDGIDYHVSTPEVDGESALAEKVNALIQERVDRHLEKARQDWDDYREAFFATGGTEEEWGGRTMDVSVDYEIKSQTEDRISFVVVCTEGWVASYEERSYYNLDFAGERDLTLRDLLGEDWVNICNAAIQAQIDESIASGEFNYFFAPEEGGFTSVDESTSFYIREDGKAVVCFPKYSIAAGAAGNLEFVIDAA